MSTLDNATDVVALLTPNSLDRPWILYEAGVAKGKLEAVVFGLAINVPLSRASIGPFAQFQNSDADAEALTKLVLQLIKRNSDAEPREEAIRIHVAAFRNEVSKLETTVKPAKTEKAPPDSGAVARLFEEVKVMFQELPERVELQLGDSRPPERVRRRRFNAKLADELLHYAYRAEDPRDLAALWLMVASIFRDDQPWLYELALEVHRELGTGNRHRLRVAVRRYRETISRLEPLILDLMPTRDGFEVLRLASRLTDALTPMLSSEGKTEQSAEEDSSV